MKDNCLDIGTIQAFLDGELAKSESARAASHIAVCEACSAELALAEDQTALVFPVLERELDTLVPTQRLWARINESLEDERRQAPFWKRAFAFLSFGLSTPTMAAAAASIIVFCVVAALFIGRGPSSVDTAGVQPVPQSRQTVVVPVTSDPAPILPESDTQDDPVQPSVIQAVHREPVRNARDRIQPATSVSEPSRSDFIAVEENYLKTIATLSRTVSDQKDTVMRPSERIAYERDMAVVDDAIGRIRAEVKKNPRDESAKQVLYSSYQNKIDLLNSITQKEELIASLN